MPLTHNLNGKSNPQFKWQTKLCYTPYSQFKWQTIGDKDAHEMANRPKLMHHIFVFGCIYISKHFFKVYTYWVSVVGCHIFGLHLVRIRVWTFSNSFVCLAVLVGCYVWICLSQIFFTWVLHTFLVLCCGGGPLGLTIMLCLQHDLLIDFQSSFVVVSFLSFPPLQFSHSQTNSSPSLLPNMGN